MPEDAKNVPNRPTTFQQTAPRDSAPLTGKEAGDRAVAANAPGAEATASSPGLTTVASSADDDRAAIQAADAETDLGEGNVQGKSVTARLPDGSERQFGSEEEAMAAGAVVTGFADGLPFVASRPAYLAKADADTSSEGDGS
jgi:hypothetical protein